MPSCCDGRTSPALNVTLGHTREVHHLLGLQKVPGRAIPEPGFEPSRAECHEAGLAVTFPAGGLGLVVGFFFLRDVGLLFFFKS